VKLPGRIVRVDLKESREAGPGDARGFLTLHRLTVVNTYADGKTSAPYAYDGVLRQFLDAVVIALTASVDGRESVCLRTTIRPPLLMRDAALLPQADDQSRFALLELPAGLIEGGDVGEAGIRQRAALETLEETGYRVPVDGFEALGSAPFISPGVIPERAYFVSARVTDVSCRVLPAGDGSTAEEGCDIVWIPLDDAIKMCDFGEIVDMKTELGLRRLTSSMW
jgi:ADP-ribose pyrophosphatase